MTLRTAVTKTVQQPDNREMFRSDVAPAFESDILNNASLIKAATRVVLQKEKGIVCLEDFSLKFHKVGDDRYQAETDLAQKLRISTEELHVVLKLAMLGVSGVDQRLGEMKAHCALSGFTPEEVPLFQSKLDSIAAAVSSHSQERRFQRAIEWAESVWDVHLKGFFGGMAAKSVGTNTLSWYIEIRRGEKASNATINRELSLLQRSFMLGYEAEPRKVAGPLRFHRLAESKPRQGFIEQKQYDELVKHCPNLWMRAMSTLGYSFGFRREELVTLKVSDVNLLAACMTGKGTEDFVFTRPCGKPIKDFRGIWDKITLAAGCPGLLFHDLRRSAVRNMVRAGIPEVVCMTVSGHKTRNVFDRYNITSERDLEEAARKIELSYRQAKVEKTEEQAQEAQRDTIQ